MVKLNCSAGKFWSGFFAIVTGSGDRKCCSSAYCFDQAPQELASRSYGHLATILSWGSDFIVVLNFFQSCQLRLGSNCLGT